MSTDEDNVETVTPRINLDHYNFDAVVEDYLADGGGDIPPVPREPRLVLVTPAVATDWLNANTENRKLRAAKVAAFSRDMTRGAWDPEVGDHIHVNEENGLLGNGQHRLAAVEESGLAQWFWVATVSRSTLTKVDRGTRRTIADAILFEDKLAGRVSSTISPLVSSIARRLVIVENGYSPTGGAAGFVPSDDEILSTVRDRYDEISEAARVATRIRNADVQVRASITGLAYVICSTIDKDAANKFFVEQLAENVGLAKDDPANALRRRLANHRNAAGTKMTDADQWNYMISAWNHFRRGNKVEKLGLPRNGWDGSDYALPI